MTTARRWVTVYGGPLSGSQFTDDTPQGRCLHVAVECEGWQAGLVSIYQRECDTLLYVGSYDRTTGELRE